MEKYFFQTLFEISIIKYVLCKPRKHYPDKGKILNFISEKSAWPCRCDLCVHSTLYCQISSFIGLFFCVLPVLHLSSPRTKRAGPKGLCAESSRAVTGKHCPHSGRGEDFLTGQPNDFTETAVTPEKKVEKWFPRWEINRHAEG